MIERTYPTSVAEVQKLDLRPGVEFMQNAGRENELANLAQLFD